MMVNNGKNGGTQVKIKSASTLFFPSFKEYLAEFVYGGIDGSVTTFAVVSGATGASFSSKVIIVLGIANLLADGLSMSFGSYLSARTEKERYFHKRRSEYSEIENSPELEVEDIRKIYKDKGFEDQLLEDAIKQEEALWEF